MNSRFFKMKPLHKLVFRKTSSRTFPGLSLFLLSVIICPVFEKIRSDGTDVATMLSLVFITSHMFL